MGLVNRLKFYWLLARILLGLYQATSIVLVDFGLSDADLDLLLWALDRSPKVKARIELIDLSNTQVKNPKDTKQRVNTLMHAKFNAFPALRTLILDKNQLMKLAIVACPSMEKISVKINKLKEIQGLGQLLGLRTLDIYGNKFVSININRHLFLQELNAARNNLKAFDFSNNVQLQKVSLQDNPLQAIRFNDNPETKINYNESQLDEPTRLYIQRMKAQQTTPTAVTNLDSSYRVVHVNPNIQLTDNAMDAYFQRTLHEKSAALSLMLTEARRLYVYIMSVHGNMEAMNAFKIIEYVFPSTVNTYLQNAMRALSSPDASDNQYAQGNNQLIEDFLDNEFKDKMKPKFAKAKQMFFSTGLEKARTSFVSRTSKKASGLSLKA